MLRYFLTPNYLLKYMPRNGSTSFAQAILNKHYVNLLNVQKTRYAHPQFLLPFITTPDRPTVVLIREPIQRFISGASALFPTLTVDFLISTLKKGFPVFDYIFSQVKLLRSIDYKYSKFLKFPENLTEALFYLDIDSLDHINKTNTTEKIVLNDNQINDLQEIYKEDYDLYNSL